MHPYLHPDKDACVWILKTCDHVAMEHAIKRFVTSLFSMSASSLAEAEDGMIWESSLGT